MGTAPAGGGGVASGAGAPDFAVQKGALDFEEVWAEDEACAPEAALAWGGGVAEGEACAPEAASSNVLSESGT